MKPTLVARIPSQVTYAFREPTEVAIGWDDIEETGMTARVDPAFPVEAGNGETLSRALSWARGHRPGMARTRSGDPRRVLACVMPKGGQDAAKFPVISKQQSWERRGQMPQTLRLIAHCVMRLRGRSLSGAFAGTSLSSPMYPPRRTCFGSE